MYYDQRRDTLLVRIGTNHLTSNDEEIQEVHEEIEKLITYIQILFIM